MSQFLALEIGGTKLQLSLGDAHANIVDRRRFQVDPAQGGAGIRRQIETSLPDLLRSEEIRAIGCGFGGPVDRRTGRIACSHQIEGWSDFPITDWLAHLSGKPVAVENDANTAALGEALRGAGRGLDPVFYVTLGSGVGGGLVVNEQIYHGHPPGEAEIGHVRLNKEGAIVESKCSGWAVDRKIRAAIAAGKSTALRDLAGGGEGGEAKFLGRAIAMGDPVAAAILDETSDDLAFGLSHATHLFHPAIIILGGGLALLGEPLRERVSARLAGYLMEVFRPGPQVALAALAEDAVPVGALCLARQTAKARK